MVFLASFIKYFIILIFLAVVAVLGVFAGKKLRDNKDAKTAALEGGDKLQNEEK